MRVRKHDIEEADYTEASHIQKVNWFESPTIIGDSNVVFESTLFSMHGA